MDRIMDCHNSGEQDRPEVSLLGEAREIDLHSILSEPVTSLMVTGIVNPFGPTLEAIGLLGEVEPGVTLRLIRVMLNPFSQEALELGSVSLGQELDPASLLERFTDLTTGSCPTLLLPNAQLDASEARRVYGSILARFPDSAAVLDRVRRYYGNPWDRVSEEMRMSTELLKARLAGHGADSRRPEPLGDGEALELADLLLSPQHIRPEFEAFNYAWNGAISQAPALPAMSLPGYLIYFFRVTETCVRPDVEVA
jgi:hypothetical protein